MSIPLIVIEIVLVLLVLGVFSWFKLRSHKNHRGTVEELITHVRTIGDAQTRGNSTEEKDI